MDSKKELEMDNEEMSEEEIDALLDVVWKKILKDEEGVHIINPQRMKEFLACGEIIKHLFPEIGTKIQIIPHDTFPNIGTIRVIAKEFKIYDTSLFVKATSKASNYEIYPRTDGKIMLAITFYGITNNK